MNILPLETKSAASLPAGPRGTNNVDPATITTSTAPQQAPPTDDAPPGNPSDADDAPKLPKVLTLRSPDELVNMEFTDDDIILGDRVLADGQPLVIAAAGGTGKSRLLLQLVASIVAGRDFVGIPTRGTHRRWLILQTENSNRRLKQDLLNLWRWLDEAAWQRFKEQVLIHTLEAEHDGFVSLDSPQNRLLIGAAIEKAAPDVVCIDPLNEFGIGDLNKDCDMRATLTALGQLCRHGNPRRAIVALHHAITGRNGAAKATGHDRASFGRNSKTLHSWARAQVNLAPFNPDDNRQLVVACGKLSNGPEFAPFGIALGEDGIYAPDPSINVAQWAADIAGTAKQAPLMTPERVAELCAEPMEKSDLAKLIREDCGCERQSAYRYIKRAEMAGKVKFSKSTNHYTRK